MEKVAVFVDQNRLNETIRQNEKAVKILNEIAQLYRTLSLGPLTHERLKEISNNKFEGIRADIAASVDSNLKKLKLDNEAMIEVLTTNVFDKFNQFEKTCRELNHKVIECRQPVSWEFSAVPVEVDFFTVKEGYVTLTAENVEQLKDLCTTYLKTDYHHKLWGALNELREKMLEVKILLASGGINTPLFYTDGNPGFIDDNANLHGEMMDF